MADPPDEPPGDLFGDPPEEPRDEPREPLGAPREDADDPESQEPAGTRRSHDDPDDSDLEPPGRGYEGARYRDDEPQGGDDSPSGHQRDEASDEPRYRAHDLEHDEPDEPGQAPERGSAGASESRPGRFRLPRYGRSESREPPHAADVEQPTGELFEHEPFEQLSDEAPPEFVDEFGDELPVAPPGDLLGDLGEEVHSASELAQRRAEERAQRRRAGRQRLLALILGVIVVVVVVVLVTSGGSGKPTTITPPNDPLAAAGVGVGHLAAGSSATVLPANILIADRNNNRLVVISPLGRVVWTQALTGPSDAFLSLTGHSIIVTEPGSFVALQLAVSDRHVLYRYGHSGHPGVADNRLHDPETAQELGDGRLVIADKSNCRIVFLAPPSHRPVSSLGTPGACLHDPPKNFGYPDAVFPALSGGGVVVTEVDPAWIDVINSAGAVTSQLRVPTLSVPDDANEYAAGELIATSHSHPGAVEEVSTAGKVLWSYGPTSGPGELDRPSLAVRLPGGDVLVCDSDNDRIIVIDPQTNTIVWQYGHTHVPGSKPGYLHTPDSAILVASSSQ
jgi:DNA-binding beta-propeller fold protein YncE